MTPFNRYLRDRAAFTEEDLGLLNVCFQRKEILKGDVVQKQGAVCDTLWFLESGFLVYSYKPTQISGRNPKETTLYFTPPDTLFTVVEAFGRQTVSPFGIKALSDAVLLECEHETAQRLFEQLPPWAAVVRKTLEEVQIATTELALSRQTQTATQRLEAFQDEWTPMLPYVSSAQIASYLGIAPETLSRLRAISR